MEYPTHYASHEDRRSVRSEAHRNDDEGIISIELKALLEICFAADDFLDKEERIGRSVEYTNRAGGTTQLNWDHTADIFDAEGILIVTVFPAKRMDDGELCPEHPQGFFLGPIEEDGYRADYSITDLNDKGIEAMMEMLAPTEDQERY